jgi:hypothetical protein
MLPNKFTEAILLIAAAASIILAVWEISHLLG